MLSEDVIIKFLNECHIIFEEFNQLNGVLVPRDIFLSHNTYENVKEQIPALKKIFCSSSMTSLQSKAEESQKWPLLNLVRQILKSCNHKMSPIRKSDGYSLEGKKKYKRYFLIEKLKSIQ